MRLLVGTVVNSAPPCSGPLAQLSMGAFDQLGSLHRPQLEWGAERVAEVNERIRDHDRAGRSLHGCRYNHVSPSSSSSVPAHFDSAVEEAEGTGVAVGAGSLIDHVITERMSGGSDESTLKRSMLIAPQKSGEKDQSTSGNGPDVERVLQSTEWPSDVIASDGCIRLGTVLVPGIHQTSNSSSAASTTRVGLSLDRRLVCVNQSRSLKSPGTSAHHALAAAMVDTDSSHEFDLALSLPRRVTESHRQQESQLNSPRQASYWTPAAPLRTGTATGDGLTPSSPLVVVESGGASRSASQHVPPIGPLTSSSEECSSRSSFSLSMTDGSPQYACGYSPSYSTWTTSNGSPRVERTTALATPQACPQAPQIVNKAHRTAVQPADPSTIQDTTANADSRGWPRSPTSSSVSPAFPSLTRSRVTSHANVPEPYADALCRPGESPVMSAMPSESQEAGCTGSAREIRLESSTLYTHSGLDSSRVSAVASHSEHLQRRSEYLRRRSVAAQPLGQESSAHVVGSLSAGPVHAKPHLRTADMPSLRSFAAEYPSVGGSDDPPRPKSAGLGSPHVSASSPSRPSSAGDAVEVAESHLPDMERDELREVAPVRTHNGMSHHEASCSRMSADVSYSEYLRRRSAAAQPVGQESSAHVVGSLSAGPVHAKPHLRTADMPSLRSFPAEYPSVRGSDDPPRPESAGLGSPQSPTPSDLRSFTASGSVRFAAADLPGASLDTKDHSRLATSSLRHAVQHPSGNQVQPQHRTATERVAQPRDPSYQPRSMGHSSSQLLEVVAPADTSLDGCMPCLEIEISPSADLPSYAEDSIRVSTKGDSPVNESETGHDSVASPSILESVEERLSDSGHDILAPTATAVPSSVNRSPRIDQAVVVHGASVRTWTYPSPKVERVQVAFGSYGRPYHAEAEIWQGPDYTPCKMRIYNEDGQLRPFHIVMQTPNGPNTIAVRNIGRVEFPVVVDVSAETIDEPSVDCISSSMVIQGGALRTYPFEPSVECVQVLLKTDGLPLDARIELLQGPNNKKQVVKLITEDALQRPFFCLIETPGSGNVVTVLNAGPVEFPMMASVVPHHVRTDTSLLSPHASDSFALVHGGSLRTWSYPSSEVEEVQVEISTEGRPLDACIELWHGPNSTPCRMRVFNEDGKLRPFSAVVRTPHCCNTIAVRNVGHAEFPFTANVFSEQVEQPLLECTKSFLNIQGGALRTYPFDPLVASVQVVLQTDGRPLNARIELLQGPGSNKQVIELYTENGIEQPFFCVLKTPGSGNVVRVVNTASVEFPLKASVIAHLIDPELPSEALPKSVYENVIIGGDIDW